MQRKDNDINKFNLVKFIVTEILEYVKCSQQIPAVVLWFFPFIVILVIFHDSTKDISFVQQVRVYLPKHLFISGDISETISKYYVYLTFIYYLLLSVIRTVNSAPSVSQPALGSWIKRAILGCVIAYLPLFLYIPFMKLAPDTSRIDMVFVFTVFAIATLLATIYALCVTYVINIITYVINKSV